MTAIISKSLRFADATRHFPASPVYPVFTPFAPW